MEPSVRIAPGPASIRGRGATRRIEMAPLEDVPGLVHLFTTRGADEAAAIADAGGDPVPLVTLRQVHGRTVHVVAGPPAPGAVRAEGDALVTGVPGVVVGVFVADCAPILIADERRRVAAAVHAGWRGTVAGVLGETVATMRSRFGSDAASLRVAIGPAIGPCCFEVGDEVVEALVAAHPEARSAVRSGAGGARSHVDLPEANRLQAMAAGVPAANIVRAGLCTRCLPELLASYRRDGAAAGRTAAIIGWSDRAL